jgi:hypothetical protein
MLNASVPTPSVPVSSVGPDSPVYVPSSPTVLPPADNIPASALGFKIAFGDPNFSGGFPAFPADYFARAAGLDVSGNVERKVAGNGDSDHKTLSLASGNPFAPLDSDAAVFRSAVGKIRSSPLRSPPKLGVPSSVTWAADPVVFQSPKPSHGTDSKVEPDRNKSRRKPKVKALSSYEIMHGCKFYNIEPSGDLWVDEQRLLNARSSGLVPPRPASVPVPAIAKKDVVKPEPATVVAQKAGPARRAADPSSKRSLKKAALRAGPGSHGEKIANIVSPGPPVVPPVVVPVPADLPFIPAPIIVPSNQRIGSDEKVVERKPAKPPVGPIVHLNCLVNPNQMRYLELNYPGVNFVKSLTETVPHTHPLLALERLWAEAHITKEVSKMGKIVDIGGNAQRHNASADGVWSCCPLLSHEDSLRNFRYTGLGNWCSHTFQECHCVDPDAYMMVHSIYYVSPELVCQAVQRAKRHVLWSVHHMFPNVIGAFADGEAQYSVDENMMVTMFSNGNVTNYYHDACSWLNDGYYVSKDGMTAMAWTPERVYPNSVVMRFVASEPGMPKPVTGYRGFAPALVSNSYYGPMPFGGVIGKSGKDSTPAALYQIFERCAFISWGKFVIATDTDTLVKITIPKAAVSEASKLMVGKARTPIAFSTLCSQVRHFMKSYNIPEEMMDKATAYAAALGFVKNLDFEMECMQSFLAPRLGRMATFGKMLQFDFPTVVPSAVATVVGVGILSAPMVFRVPTRLTWLTHLLGVSLVTGPLVWHYFRRPPRIHHDETKIDAAQRYRYGSLFGVVPATGVMKVIASGLLAGCFRREFVDLGMREAFLGNDLDKTGFVVPVEGLVPVQRPYLTTTEADIPLRPLDTPYVNEKGLPDMRFMPRVTWNGEIFENPVRNAVVGAGVIIPEVIPIVHASSGHNELLAFHNRAAVVPFAPNDDYVLYFEHFVKAYHKVIFPDLSSHRVVYDFDAWNRRFPRGRQKAHLKAYEANNKYFIPDDSTFVRKSFNKAEKRLDSSVVEYKPGVPRPISGNSDEWNVATGPYYWAIGKVLAEVWNSEFCIYYTAGSNAEQIGAWLEQFGHNNSLYRYGDGDFKWFDSSQALVVLSIILWVFGLFSCIPSWIAKDEDGRLIVVGCTAHGVIFRLVGSKTSGDGNTMSGNSILNGLVSLFVYCLCNPKLSVVEVMRRMNLLIVGDDSDHVCMRTLNPPDPHYYAMLGLKFIYTPRDNSYCMEFCSSRFWPTSTGIVLGRKPGCAIPKLGWYLQCPAKKVDGVHLSTLIGELNGCRFIPPTYAIVRAQLNLLQARGVKAVKLTRDLRRTEENIRVYAQLVHQPTEETYSMLTEVYDWTPEDQSGLEQCMSALSSLPSVLSYPPLSKLLTVDADLPGLTSGLLANSSNAYEVFVDNFLRQLGPPPKIHIPAHKWDLWFSQCIFAPVWEEAFKKVHFGRFPVGLFTLVYAETFATLISAWGLGDEAFTLAMSARMCANFMHVVTYFMPYVLAVPAHAFWNANALLQQKAVVST